MGILGFVCCGQGRAPWPQPAAPVPYIKAKAPIVFVLNMRDITSDTAPANAQLFSPAGAYEI